MSNFQPVVVPAVVPALVPLVAPQAAPLPGTDLDTVYSIAAEGAVQYQLEQRVQNGFTYQLLQLIQGTEQSFYLYARRDTHQQAYVLGVFDTRDQAVIFTDLHVENELTVPALALAGGCKAFVCLLDGQLHWIPYAGFYKVGHKSYQVEIDVADNRLRLVHYVQNYKAEYLGQATEKEACLLIYNHFFKRVSGCSLC